MQGTQAVLASGCMLQPMKPRQCLHLAACCMQVTQAVLAYGCMHRRSMYASAMLGPKPVWFWLHAFFQIMSMACFVAGVAISLSRFESNCESVLKGLSRLPCCLMVHVWWLVPQRLLTRRKGQVRRLCNAGYPFLLIALVAWCIG